MRHLYLIAYDVSDNANRRRVLRAIRGNAVGGQKSVYECWLDSDEFLDAHETLQELVAETNDRIVLMRLDPRAAVHTLGIGVPPSDGAVFYQG